MLTLLISKIKQLNLFFFNSLFLETFFYRSVFYYFSQKKFEVNYLLQMSDLQKNDLNKHDKGNEPIKKETESTTESDVKKRWKIFNFYG